MKYLFFALRPKDCVKNFFIFLPLIFGKKLFCFPANLKTIAAFFIFSIAAGAAYLINDIIDRKGDKLHPIKSLRPIAAGKLSVKKARVAAFILGVLAVGFSFMLDISFGWVVVFYLAFNFIYTKTLKTIVIIDVFCVGVFFLLRVIGGSVVAGVEISHWILIMTVLLSLFLGFNKRRQELRFLKDDAINHRHVLAKYNLYLIDQIIAVITSSIVLAYVLYVVDARTVKEFGGEHLMYSIPFVYYGIFRYLYLIHKIRKDGDPTRMLFGDKVMQLNVVLWVGVCIAVIYFHL